MSIPTYAAPLTASRHADWQEFGDFYEPDDRTPRDFEGCEAEITLRRVGAVVKRLRTDTGGCEITWSVTNGPLHRIQARWSATEVETAAVSGEYEAEFLVFHPDGEVEAVGVMKRVIFI